MSDGHSRRGIGLYTKELISALGKFEPSHTYSFFTKPSEIDSRADIVHYPFFDPFLLTLGRTSPKPTVVTCHDLIPIVYAEHFPRGIRGEIKWQIQKRRLRQIARTIITDSNASKADIERVLGIPRARVFAVPLAPRTGFRPVTDTKRLSEVRKRYKLNNKYILYVGDVNWNKNVFGLLESVYRSVQLVLVGKAFTDADLPQTRAIRQRIDHLGITNVVTPGFVSDNDLAGLYSQAQMLVFPSFVEGFGFPVLEAQACGCPVVTSNVPSLREIAGPGVLVDPSKPEDIRRGLDMVLSFSSHQRRLLIQKGLEWAGNFTWEKVARQTVEVYEKTFRNYSGV